MNKRSFSTLSWLRQSSFFNFNNSWLIVVLLTLIIATFGIGFAFGTQTNNNIVTNNFTKSIQLKIYKSKGSRDQNKIEQETFKLTDPIQAYLEFSSATSGTVIQYKLVDSTKKNIQTFEIPVNGNGERYFTISPQILKMKAGTYQVLIYQNENELQTKSFIIE